MNRLQGKHILLGITGSIAAYKSASIVRFLKKEGADVKVVMTPLAKEFITPLTLATLAKEPILVDFFDPTNGRWNSHVNLGIWADAYLIAPATANTIGKMANGIADNLLLTSYFSAKCPVFIAPAMDLDMFAHPATQKNINTLRSYGVTVIEPVSGELASGLEGKGRMEEPEKIVDSLVNCLLNEKSLVGKNVMITAGPTYEKIDPVRFIGNYSSGKMGFALANECTARGANVTLVCGPVQLEGLDASVNRIDVESAEEMYETATQEYKKADVGILCAAVADFTPEQCTKQKIKKKDDDGLVLKLKNTKDIAATLGQQKKSNQILVGFALETNDEETHAADKLRKKNLDFIVLNSLRDNDAGFRFDTNKVTLLMADGIRKPYELKSKVLVAKDIVDNVEILLK